MQDACRCGPGDTGPVLDGARRGGGGRGSALRSMLATAHEALNAGHPATAEVGGYRLELSVVLAHGRGIVALAPRQVDLPTANGCDDTAGDLLLRAAAGRGRVGRGRAGRIELRMIGWWRLITPVEILGVAGDFLPHVLFAALADPQPWATRAQLLTMDVASASLRGHSAFERGTSCLTLDDEEVRRWLLP